ncbi:MAG: VIT domain-containing protein [Pirellulaceae bacterium]
MKRLSTIGLGLLIASCAASAFGQGLLIVEDTRPVPLPRPIFRRTPEPPQMTYKIKELAVQARIDDQVARTQVTQSFVNTGSRQMEVSFVFPLPYDGAIDRLTFMVDGTEYEAKLMKASEARSIYEGYIRRNQDPALLEWMGTGMFKTSVFPVPPGAERKVTLRYSQLLRKDHQLTDFLFPLSTAKYTSHAVEKVSVEASIQSTQEIKSVYSPTHSIEVKRPGKHQATIKFEAQNQIPESDFRLFFDTAAGSLGASVVSYRPEPNEDGYFLLLASPEVKSASAARAAKTVVVVVDRSGSMSGKKIEQAREALKFVVNNLRDGDLFNIVAYDSSVESFRPELQKFNEETRQQAVGWIEGIYAGGSTNIDGALKTALGMFQDEKRPGYVVFLTDGLPTAGETNESKIVVNSTKNNKYDVRLINFGVGYDVNARLLDRLSRENRGQSEFVRPNEDLEAHVSRLYDKISSPVMTNVAVDFELDEVRVEEGRPVTRVYPRQLTDLFEGEQLVLVGRYKKHGPAKVTIKGRVGDDEREFDFPAELVQHSGDQSYSFVEKLWAMRRVGEIIDELDLHGANQELVTELVALSTKHGIITPYTSFLADDQPQSGPVADIRRGRDRAAEQLRQLEVADGRIGFEQRNEKKALQEANLAPTSSGFAATRPQAASEGDSAGFPGDSGRASGVKYRDLESGEEVSADGVQIVGSETLYKRGKTWIASSAVDIDPAKDAAKIKTIERFSTEYFELTKKNTAGENAVLARQQTGEELLITLRGQTYCIK